jgi:Tfp pilus assembly protein PilX
VLTLIAAAGLQAGECTLVAQPRRSKTRMTAAQISTCRGSAPCPAQAGPERCGDRYSDPEVPQA